MDSLILALTVIVFAYTCYIHWSQDNTPEEYPARMIMLLTFLSIVFQIGDSLELDSVMKDSIHSLWRLAFLYTLARVAYFLGHRKLRVNRKHNRRSYD